jgi:FkbM family methyltransferase
MKLIRNNYSIGTNSFEFLVREGKESSWYSRPKTYEEISSPLYDVIKASGYNTFIDVGSNFGLIACLAARAGMSVYCIEADPTLCPVIVENLKLNKVDKINVLNAIAGEVDVSDSTFSIHPTTSLDNRVNVNKWKQVKVQTVRLDTILKPIFDAGNKPFIKIDTQGYENCVMNGFSKYFSDEKWCAKIEFAPLWLESQGTSPVEFLKFLTSNFQVSEFPERVPYLFNSINDLFSSGCFRKRDVESFVKYVVDLNANGRGWLDLILRP